VFNLKVWHNTRIVDQYQLPADSAAWLMGDGAFETIRTYLGKPFAVDHHLRRLQNSLSQLHIKSPSAGDISTGINSVIAANPQFENGRLRVTVFSDGHLLISHMPYEINTAPAKLMRYPDTKFSGYAISSTKSTSYAENFRALRLAQSNAYDDCVLINEKGEVVESSMANILWLQDGVWYTPNTLSGALPGVTRALLIESFGVQESTLLESDLERVESLALVSSLREIQVVERYESILYPISKSLTELQSSFHAWVRDKLGV
jgi:branched-chain amino acid aminotransferase